MSDPFRRHAPRGQAIVLLAVGLTVLICATALAVDGARFYAEGLRVQKAADEAALASVTQASIYGAAAGTLSATDIVTRNLPVSNPVTVSVTAAFSNSVTNQERVVVQENSFPFLFAPVFGLKFGTITREATAQYVAPLPMGNPSNQLGDTGKGAPGDSISTYLPDDSGNAISATMATVPQNMKLSINGPYAYSESGDPYAPLNVLSFQSYVPSAPATPIKNPYRPANFDGYDYRVTIPPNSVPVTTANTATYIQVYDAEACDGDNYKDGWAASQYGLPYAPSNGTINYLGQYPTYYRLYEYNGGAKAPVTAGDLHYPSRGPYPLVSGAPAITDTVIAPKDGFNGSSDSPCDSQFQDKWYTLAAVNYNPAGASYVVNVTTCINPQSDLANLTAQTAGLYNCRGTETNNFALRAVTVKDSSITNGNNTACPTDPGVGLDCQTFDSNQTSQAAGAMQQPQVAGLGRISIEVTCGSDCSGSSNKLTPIYLANIDKAYAGKYLLVKLYDPGDLAGPSSIQIVRPNGTYAPFEWYTQTLDGNGLPFQTLLHNNQDQSIITSFPVTTTYTTPTTNTTTTGVFGAFVCPSGQQKNLTTTPPSNITPSGAPAYGQTMAEDNPFDPNIHGSPLGCLSNSEYHDWTQQPNHVSGDYKQYNLSSSDGIPNDLNYKPFNGRWIYMFTQIPTGYGDSSSPDYYNPPGNRNPNPGWWYVQYKTRSSAGFTDRAVWETQIIDVPPHLIK